MLLVILDSQVDTYFSLLHSRAGYNIDFAGEPPSAGENEEDGFVVRSTEREGERGA
jgi:hypothetical protein